MTAYDLFSTAVSAAGGKMLNGVLGYLALGCRFGCLGTLPCLPRLTIASSHIFRRVAR